ncbi:MAG: sugar transferase [Deltaproteobacteria bacterium]|nr:sugar transferase [Deltaproteobacteria bacterium]
MGPTNDAGELLKVAHALKTRGDEKCRFLLLGEGTQIGALKEEARRLDLSTVIFGGRVSRNDAAQIIAASDIGVTCFANLPVLRTNSPNKFFDYLALGLPQMVNAEGWMRETIEGSGAGFSWPHGDPEIAAARLVELASHRRLLTPMRRAAKKLAEETFERGVLTERLITIFETARNAPRGGWPVLWQGLFDRLAALAGLVLFSPVFAAVAWRIRGEDGGPVFYAPERVGLAGRPFRMIKFRTMVPNAERRGLGLNVAESDERITRTGAFLRAWSLDELPQLFNVLLGQMRLVGPRPALPDHVARYDAAQRRRLLVRPGLTGWAQVNGRNALTWDEKLRLDAWYVDNRGFFLDLKILLKTLGVVARREGLYEPDAGASDAFNAFEKRGPS